MNEYKCCYQHSGIEAEVNELKTDKETQWKAIESLREEVKKILIRLSMIIGGITAINVAATIVIDVVLKK